MKLSKLWIGRREIRTWAHGIDLYRRHGLNPDRTGGFFNNAAFAHELGLLKTVTSGCDTKLVSLFPFS